MTSKITDQNFLRTQQYADASNLSARANLHARFSTNKYGWHRWVFDQFDLPPNARILELGCGPGWMWAENRERIPAGWHVTLSDLSPGMIEQARSNVGETAATFRFDLVDAMSIPYPDASFDAVIANHMLYHVPDRPRALEHIRRILKPGGRFYTATNGVSHLREINELVRAFDSSASFENFGGYFAAEFTLENGYDQLSPWFETITVTRYEDALIVTEVEPLIAYLESSNTRTAEFEAKLDQFRQFITRKMERMGAIHITKDSGLFVAVLGCERDLPRSSRKFSAFEAP